ncbi:AMP-binding protein [Nonomuraea dietziae]|uniref:Acyl-CoA synthetase (AMP-forming)/AMP-acid ligase II n=1 Tax=Nonomuraea dietziae TaxID=65515 RepID=A0A7W5VD12_9ACTN|nr:acyl-CoA synthetase (AMP-forming)/AMP-acid ligase II [Nonomuraea dietziae]
MHPGAIAAVTPDKPAVIMAGSGQVVTYRELEEESNRLAHLFRSAGLKPGDHIAFMLENHPLFLVIAWAAQRSGLYYTAISSRLRSEELNYIVENCEARIFISSAGLAEVATTVSAPGVERRLMLDGVAEGFESYEKAVEGLPATPIEDECQGSDMLYSSGTTGRPKGVKPTLSQAPLDTPGPLLQLIQFLFAPSDDSVYLSPAPLYHAAPLRYCLQFQRLGATVVVMERFDAAEYLALVERYRVTHSQLVPTMFIKMLKLPSRNDYDLSSLKCAIHAAAPCPVPVKEQMLDWWGPIIHEYYAGTEGNGFLYAGPRRLAGPQGHGRPPPSGCGAHPGRGGRRAAARRARHGLLLRRPALRVPRRPRQDPLRAGPAGQGLDHARRHRLPRRGRLPLPDRPPLLHDHLRRGEHLPPGGGERAVRSPEGGRRGRLRRTRRGDG